MTDVLIHLNITVATDDPDEAIAEGYRYLEAHGIPQEDLALIDPT